MDFYHLETRIDFYIKHFAKREAREASTTIELSIAFCNDTWSIPKSNKWQARENVFLGSSACLEEAEIIASAQCPFHT